MKFNNIFYFKGTKIKVFHRKDGTWGRTGDNVHTEFSYFKFTDKLFYEWSDSYERSVFSDLWKNVDQYERKAIEDFFIKLMDEGFSEKRIEELIPGSHYITPDIQTKYWTTQSKNKRMTCKLYHKEVKRAEARDKDSLFLDPNFMEGYFGKEKVENCYDYKKGKNSNEVNK